MNGSNSHRTGGQRLPAVRERLHRRWQGGLLAALATATNAILFALWVIPPVPFGLQAGELTYSVWVAVVLAAGTALFGSITVLARNRVSGDRDIVEILRGIIGMKANRRLMTPRQFQRALDKECLQVSEDRRSALSLVLVRVDPSDDARRAALHETADAIMPYVRSADTIGLVRAGEIGVLAVGADAAACRRIVDRLEPALGDALEIWAGRPDRVAPFGIELGWATHRFGQDPGALLVTARRTLKPAARRERPARRSADLSAAA